MKFSTILDFDSYSSKVQIKVLTFEYQKPDYSTWDSDWDYYGGYSIDFTCTLFGEDITSDLTAEQVRKIENCIINLYEG